MTARKLAVALSSGKTKVKCAIEETTDGDQEQEEEEREKTEEEPDEGTEEEAKTMMTNVKKKSPIWKESSEVKPKASESDIEEKNSKVKKAAPSANTKSKSKPVVKAVAKVMKQTEPTESNEESEDEVMAEQM